MLSSQHDNNRERPIYQSSKALPVQSGIYEELDKRCFGRIDRTQRFQNIAMIIGGDGRKHECF